MLRRTVMTLAAVAALAAPLALAVNDAKASGKDIVDTAMEAGTFNTLATALTAAGLVETLKQDGPYTVFAPTDAAFDKLPEGTLENLLLPENRDQLVAILSYHVVEGAVGSADVADQSLAVTTLEGSAAEIDGGANGVRIDGAQVIAPDIPASNGVIHAIDTVITP